MEDAADADKNFWISLVQYILIGLAGWLLLNITVFIITQLLMKPKPPPPPPPQQIPQRRGSGNGGGGGRRRRYDDESRPSTGYGPGYSGAQPYPYYAYPQQQSGGMGILGTALAIGGGIFLGNMLANGVESLMGGGDTLSSITTYYSDSGYEGGDELGDDDSEYEDLDDGTL